MKEHTLVLKSISCTLEELNENEQLLISKAKQATENAYAPYSHFNVGAAVLLDNGEIISGTNQENAAYPSGLCAERVAMFYANSKYPNNTVKAIAIAAFTNGQFIELPISPCGACRQVLLETEIRYNQDIVCYLYGSTEIRKVQNIKTLLPFCFNADSLKVK
jgi:cytidine deaminase